MKTAESIEAQEERKIKRPRNKPQTPAQHENSRRNIPRLRPYSWQPGQSGNPRGRTPGKPEDIAAKIARAIFTNNQEELYKAYGEAALRGNAYAFKELADRAFGKLTEKHELELNQYREVSEKELIERINQLETKLGFRALPDATGGTAGDPGDQGRIETPAITKAN